MYSTQQESKEVDNSLRVRQVAAWWKVALARSGVCAVLVSTSLSSGDPSREAPVCLTTAKGTISVSFVENALDQNDVSDGGLIQGT